MNGSNCSLTWLSSTTRQSWCRKHCPKSTIFGTIKGFFVVSNCVFSRGQNHSVGCSFQVFDIIFTFKIGWRKSQDFYISFIARFGKWNFLFMHCHKMLFSQCNINNPTTTFTILVNFSNVFKWWRLCRKHYIYIFLLVLVAWMLL